MKIKLILYRERTLFRIIKIVSYLLAAILFWAFILFGGLWTIPLSNKIFNCVILFYLIWLITKKYFFIYKQIGELEITKDSININIKDSNLILRLSEIIKVRIFYKNFKKKYELNGKSIEAQMTSTRDINKIKIKSTKGIYNFHFYLDDNNYFDELYELVKTMAATGLDIKILEGNNFITNYIDEKI